MVPDELGRGRLIAFAQAGQLEEQAFLPVEGPDPDGVEFLNERQDVLHPLQVEPRRQGKILDAGGQIPVVIDAADQQFADLTILRVEFG